MFSGHSRKVAGRWRPTMTTHSQSRTAGGWTVQKSCGNSSLEWQQVSAIGMAGCCDPLLSYSAIGKAKPPKSREPSYLAVRFDAQPRLDELGQDFFRRQQVIVRIPDLTVVPHIER